MKKILFAVILVTLFYSCKEPFVMDKWYGIGFYNHTDKEIVVISAYLPDSIITIDNETVIKPNSQCLISGEPSKHKRMERFENGDTLVFMVVSDSTYKNRQSIWHTIRDVDNVIKQYNLDIETVKKQEWMIHYYGVK